MYRLVTDVDNKINQPQNPRTNANIFEILTFSWMLNLFKTGRKKDLEEGDLYTTLKDHKSSSLGDELEKKWRSELAIACKERRNPSLLRALFRMYRFKYMLCGFNHFVDEIILKMSQPLCVGGLLAYFNPDNSDNTDVGYAYVCAFGLVFGMLTSVVLYHSTEIENLQCGMMMRVSCCSVIYRKALRLSHTALGETTVGQVINLLSNDVNRFDIALTFLHFLWIGPLQTIIVTYFLWQQIGVSSILGIAALLFFIPLQGWLGKKLSEIRSNATILIDERLRLMSEIISGIQVIKMYTWEKPFSTVIEYARKKEIEQIRRFSFIKTVMTSFMIVQTRIQLFLSIFAYVMFGNYISIQKVFVITSLYNLLSITMTMFFCQGLGQVAELIVSIKRIQNFLLHDEKDSDVQNILKSDKSVVVNGTNELIADDEDRSKYGIEKTSLNSFDVVVSDATAKWKNDHVVNTIENIRLTAKPNRLVAIIGPVGAGKSSLIQAVLGELPLSAGKISVRGVVSYASQIPWLFSGSVRQNILFDSPMDTKRYEQVVKACALKNDFKQFPYGDRTTVGERGVTLSGGQKARINLARTVYKQADIYLLDDPLSAVDTRVGKHLFDKCVRGFLKGKTCILVTHQIQYLTNVDQIVLMKNGNILTEGSYQELQASGIDFTKPLGSSKETKLECDIEGNGNKLRNSLGHDSFLCGSSESIQLFVDGNKANEPVAEPNEEAEYHSFGHVTRSVYVSYMSASGSTRKILFCLFMFVVTQVLITGGDYWICFWVNQEEYVFRSGNVTSTDETSMTNNPTDMLTMAWNNRRTYVTIYTVLIVSAIIAIVIRSVVFISSIMVASTNLHKMMFDAIIRATMYFFNTNSSGRIFNRFSKDIGAIDDILPFTLLDCLQGRIVLAGHRAAFIPIFMAEFISRSVPILSSILGIVFVVGLINIHLMIPTLFVGIVFHQFRNFYLPASRSIKRLEGVTRSPVFAHFNASIQGLTTIRAYEAEQILSQEFDKCQDLHSSAWYLFISSNEAFGLWLDIVCLIYISIVVFSFIVIGSDVYGGNVGLVITQTIGLAGMVQWGIRQSAVLENQMTSVERVLEYTNCPQEPVLQSPTDKIPSKDWPKFGKIVFENVSLRYSPDTSQVLKNLNFVIQPMEKVGIVGRTGAGKSSIIGALFRLAVVEGNILIDDVEIHGLELHDLRSKISIIPQEPVLFSGTMRSNLDPFDEYPDHVLWNALDEVQLKTVIEILPGGLNSKMSENGSNFSIGQRQLVCLARAIVRNNKILILDEATANVDPQTDSLIQNTIRNKFRTCTVLTIAHRLNTIMDSDRVLVMDAGKIVEFDHPHCLLRHREDGFLYQMVEQTGQTTANLLHNVAAENFNAINTEMESSIRFIDEHFDGA